ncbi:MAG: hypothetical protein AB7L13_13000 [Acidimicrobiia bacterium]
MTTEWTKVPATELKPGHKVRYRTGAEFQIARIDAPFLGRAEMICLIEDTPVRWHAYPVRVVDEVEVSR